MAFDSGKQGSGSVHHGKSDWDYHLENNKRFLSKVIDLRTAVVYKTKTKGITTYFLSKGDDYLGKIQVEQLNGSNRILSSHSNTKGFYQIIFPVILQDTNMEILSDISLSSEAIKAYVSLYKKTKTKRIFNIEIKVGNKYYPFSKDLLLQGGNKVSINDNNNIIEEHLKDFLNRPDRLESYKLLVENDKFLNVVFGKLEN